MAGESKKSTREKAAEARAAAQAAERRRERMIRIIGGVVVLAVVLGILAIGVITSRNNEAPTADENSPKPAGVDATYGIVINTAENSPTLEIYEDPQCPACASLEASLGGTIQEAVDNGDVSLTYRPMIFLDANLGTDSSERAAAAWGCAVDAGKAQEYHNTIFANQPATEGDGWTDEQLIAFGEQSGITGAEFDTFSTCVTDGTYRGWAQLSNEAAFDRGVTGTPSLFLNGEELTRNDLASEAAFQEAIANATQ